ncbi:hypothetical protein EV193_104342 [Herbihabitans rhizosphaerae]|uniref:HNH endonuclease n=1 Tax=Herbihabitans rhizosphaerae TaxID=1872711 RepID=A0A4Q7KRT8_9PSEU|nr:HNH endonuclease signature motif containing protein [Herbihabitans rhizosphaerae]RZS39126.1 hypothetical protein EV193_104342 [Herbihabitans rhizosphaerae]
MAWDTSTRRDELPGDWNARRLAVLGRDMHQCRWRTPEGVCGLAATEVDHIRPGGDHSYSNLRALCSWHHRRKSSSEGGRAAALNRPPRRRAPERHPGDL